MNYLGTLQGGGLRSTLKKEKKKKKGGEAALYAAEGIIGRKLSVRARKMWLYF